MISDGVADVKSEEVTDIRTINLQPLERLARSVTIRLLYTDPVTGKSLADQGQAPARQGLDPGRGRDEGLEGFHSHDPGQAVRGAGPVCSNGSRTTWISG